MKLNLKYEGYIELVGEDILEVLKRLQLKKSDSLFKAVYDVVLEKTGYITTKIQQEQNLEKIVAIVNGKIDDGGKLVGSLQKQQVERAPTESFERKFMGFYDAANVIFQEYKSKGKKNIPFEKFYRDLLNYDDEKGNKMFVKDEVAIDRNKVKLYLMPSQIKKNIKDRPNLKSVKYDKESQEFKF